MCHWEHDASTLFELIFIHRINIITQIEFSVCLLANTDFWRWTKSPHFVGCIKFGSVCPCYLSRTEGWSQRKPQRSRNSPDTSEASASRGVTLNQTVKVTQQVLVAAKNFRGPRPAPTARLTLMSSPSLTESQLLSKDATAYNSKRRRSISEHWLKCRWEEMIKGETSQACFKAIDFHELCLQKPSVCRNPLSKDRVRLLFDIRAPLKLLLASFFYLFIEEPWYTCRFIAPKLRLPDGIPTMYLFFFVWQAPLWFKHSSLRRFSNNGFELKKNESSE